MEGRNAMKKTYYTYLVCCEDASLYCGYTTDLDRRLKAHNDGMGGKYTASRRPVRLVYWETFEDRGEAMSRECHIKRMSRRQKLRLIAENPCAGEGDKNDKINDCRRK